MSSDLFNVPEDGRKKALEIFDKTQATVKEDVEIIIKWMKTQSHLPEIMEDFKIKNFLLLNKYSIEKTKQKIDMYYTIRSLFPEIFNYSNPKTSNLRSFMETSYCCVHPQLVDGLYRVYFLKGKQPNSFAPKEIGMQCSNIGEIRLHEDCMLGDIFIFDMSTITLADHTKITPTLMVKLVSIYEKVYSQRVKAAYIINSSSYVARFTAILKMVVKQKIFNRIKVCENADILDEVFRKEALPKDYGGEGPSLDELNEMMTKKLEEYQVRFDRLDELRVDEKLRPKPLNNDEILGFYGNFKKLDID